MNKNFNSGKGYSLWNPFTNIEEFAAFRDIGPMTIVRGEGVYVYNQQNKRFINGTSSLWNVAVGHGRKELIEAATEQMERLSYSSCFRQVHPRALELADKLIQITGNKYSRVYLGSNGSEAIETAIKIARQFFKQSPHEKDRGKYKIFSLKGSYHGVSYGALSTSGLESDGNLYGPLVPGFFQIDPPYFYRCPYQSDSELECNNLAVKALEEKILEEGEDTVAAFIVEPIMGVAGIIKPNSSFFEAIGRICQKYNILLIADEVTTGFGRTGKLFASETWTVSPDILCLGKAISSGYLPVSATLATKRICDHFQGKDCVLEHGSTASGHPVCAAVAIKNIDLIINEKLPENAARVGQYLMENLQQLAERRSIVGEVRGEGLMIGIELVADKDSRKPLEEKKVFEIVTDIALQGLIVYYSRNTIALMPPLIIDYSLCDEIVAIIARAFDVSKKNTFSKKTRVMSELIKAKTMKVVTSKSA